MATALPSVVLLSLLLVGCSSRWPMERKRFCGDSEVDESELCDGDDDLKHTCKTLTAKGPPFEGGKLKCGKDCLSYDTSGCYRCRDGKRNPAEICDGPKLGNKTCKLLGYDGGMLTCQEDCKGFVFKGCYKCGDGKKNGPAEVCDGGDLAGQSCKLKYFDGGTLACNKSCAGYDTSDCHRCGDGKINGKELCDGAVVGVATCEKLGFDGGTKLKCKSDCTDYDMTSCWICGDQLKNGPKELCDGAALAGKACKDLGYYMGTLACKHNCKAFDTSKCRHYQYEGVVDMGGTGSDGVNDIAVDSAGNTYITGGFVTKGVFGTTTLTAKAGPGKWGYFVAKLDSAGKYLWVKPLDGPAAAMALQGNNTLHMTGSYWAAATFGKKKLPKPKSQSLWVARLDAAGGFKWVTTAGEASGFTYGNGVAAGGSGSVHVIGSTTAGPTFGPTTLPKSKYRRIWVARLDASGKFAWAVTAKNQGHSYSEGIALDSAGSLRVVSWGETELSPCKATKGAAVFKLNNKGACLWSADVGTTSSTGDAVAVDGAGNAYVAGSFRGTASLGTITLYSSKQSTKGFVARIDNSGKFVWGHALGGGSNDYATDVHALSSGELAVTGSFRSKGNFGGTILTATQVDGWVARFTAAGKLRWATNAGHSYLSSSGGFVVALAPSGKVNVAGRFSGTSSFGTYKAKARGDNDIFVARLGSPP